MLRKLPKKEIVRKVCKTVMVTNVPYITITITLTLTLTIEKKLIHI